MKDNDLCSKIEETVLLVVGYYSMMPMVLLLRKSYNAGATEKPLSVRSM